MRSKRHSPVWPYLGILACLFVLCITAPRAWHRMARQDPASHVPRRGQFPRRETREAVRYEKLEGDELTARQELDDAKLREPRTAAPLEAAPAVKASLRVRPTETQPIAEADSPLPPVPEDLPLVVAPVSEFAREAQEPLEVAARPMAPAEKSTSDAPHEKPQPAAASAAAPEGNDQAGLEVASPWPLPKTLLEQLDLLAQEDPNSLWAQQAEDLIHELCQGSTDGETAARLIEQLRETAQRGAAAVSVDPPLEAQIARTRYALARWLDAWEASLSLEKLTPEQTLTGDAAAGLSRCLAQIDAMTRKAGSGTAWREFLQLEKLKQLDRDDPEQTVLERRQLARTVLDRLSSSQLSRAQKKFIQEGPLADLRKSLRCWAAEDVSAQRLLVDLEQYERTLLPTDARRVAEDFRGLSWSSTAEAQKLSEHVDTHYRNANLRIALTGALLNRMVPQPQATEAPVRDTVVNVPVYGTSTTFTKLFVRLVPDPSRIRMGLEANGLVASDTVSTSGPATLYNEGQSSFLVRKLFVLGPNGLSMWPAVAEAENKFNYLISLETDFDGVPLVSSLVRNIARNQYEQAQGEARLEVEQKVAIRARDQLDAEVRPRIVKAAENVEKKQLATLKRLGMEAAPIGFSTSEERVVARVRLGTPQQLGAHTPRPRAPSDSWMSLQLHQSALNNVLEQLDLEGREFALPQLFVWIGRKLDRPQMAELEDLPEDVHLTFAKENAVRVRCRGERVEVTLAFAELTQGRKRWRDFTVHTLYQPSAQGLQASFTRDPQSPISLDGKSVKGKPEPVLRAIFAKVLSRSRDINLLDESLTSDERLQGLEITRFTVDDGWIGVAYSPARVRSNVARRPK